MQGRRIYPPADDTMPCDIDPILEPGDYCYLPEYRVWCVRAPNGDTGTLMPTVHKIVENPDRTITVSPSIQFMTGKRWHGYLEAGEWRHV